MVSIITPSYNQCRFIEDNILSVKEQDYPSIEHIIIDGNSTDGTIDILEKYEGTYNMRWISEPDKGQSHALNKGFSIAQGEIIGWLNSDDIYLHTHVSSSIAEFFNSHPNADIIYGDFLVIDSENKLIELTLLPEFSRKLLLIGNYFSQPSVFMRATVVRDNKLAENLHFGMDYEYWLRLSSLYNFQHISLIASGFRCHSEAKTSVQRDRMKAEVKQIREGFGVTFGIGYYLWRVWWKLVRAQGRYRGASALLSGLHISKGYDFTVTLERGSLVVILGGLLPLELRPKKARIV